MMWLGAEGSSFAARMPRDRHERVSKWMTMALRHRAHLIGLDMDENGSVDLVQLSAVSPRFSVAEIQEVVETSDKGRFQILAGRVRALSGHSTEMTEEFRSRRRAAAGPGVAADGASTVTEMFAPPVGPDDAQNLPFVLMHGTIRGRADSIWERGVLPMDREAVHLTDKHDFLRVYNDMIIEVRVADLLDCSTLTLRRARNGVFLVCEPIPPSLFYRILEKKGGMWETTWTARWARRNIEQVSASSSSAEQ